MNGGIRLGGTSISLGRIDQFWRNIPSIYDVLHMNENECCYACGAEKNLERAHILAKTFGGSNKASNFHVLCFLCHTESESLDGVDYWIWLSLKSHFYYKGSLVPLEEEVKNDEKNYLPYEAELQTKIESNPLLFARLLLYRDNYITRYHEAWSNFKKIRLDYIEKEEKPLFSLPETRLEFVKTFCMAMLGDLFEKYEEAIDFGICASEHAQKFLKGEL